MVYRVVTDVREAWDDILRQVLRDLMRGMRGTFLRVLQLNLCAPDYS